MKDLNLLNERESRNLQGVTYRQFTASLVEVDEDTNIIQAVADKLNLKVSSASNLILKFIEDFISDINNYSNCSQQ